MFIGRKTFTALTLATSVLGASAFADDTQNNIVSHTDFNTLLISGDIISFVVWPDNSQYEKFHLSSSLHSRLYIPPGFYNGFLCLEPSIYCYHLGYSGSYIDADDQYTLSIEDSCVPIGEISAYYPINAIIRSLRDC